LQAAPLAAALPGAELAAPAELQVLPTDARPVASTEAAAASEALQAHQPQAVPAAEPSAA
jgi:hypothetical protein